MARVGTTAGIGDGQLCRLVYGSRPDNHRDKSFATWKARTIRVWPVSPIKAGSRVPLCVADGCPGSRKS